MIAICGGILAVHGTSRRALIEKEDKELIYPEGKTHAPRL